MTRPIAGFTFRLALAVVLLVLLMMGLANRCFGQAMRFDSVAQTTAVASGVTVATPVPGAAITVCPVAGISTVSQNNTAVTVITAVVHGFSAGQAVNVYGVTVAGYNGTFTIATTPTTTSFTYNTTGGLGPSSGGAAAPANIPCTPVANLYTDAAMGAIGSNPVAADAQGNFGFWAASGNYVYTMSGAGLTPTLYNLTLAPNSGGNNSFTGNNTFSGSNLFSNLNAIRFADRFPGITPALQIQAACTNLGGPGVVVIPSSMTVGLPLTIANDCTLLDFRGNVGNGGIFIGRALHSDSNAFTVFAYSCPDLINCRAGVFDLSYIVGGSQATNYAGVQGFVNAPGSAAVGGTNYGGVTYNYQGTVSCTGTACIGTGTNFGTGATPNMTVGDIVAPSGTRPGACERIVTVVASAVSFTIDADFSGPGPQGLVCPTGANPSGITLVRIESGDGIHGDGINLGAGGTVGVASGSGYGNIYRPQVAVRGIAGPISHYGVGVEGVACATCGPAGVFTKGVNGDQIRVAPATWPAVVTIHDPVTSPSPNGQEVLRIGAQGAGGTPGSGPKVVFDNGTGTPGVPPTDLAELRVAVASATLAGYELWTYNSGLHKALAVSGTGDLTPVGALKLPNLLLSPIAPTISSGFGTSPSVGSNGTASFIVNVGGGGAATSGVIGLPTASVGWNCFCEDATTFNTTVFRCRQTANSTSTATIGNFNTAASAAAWGSGDVLIVSCFAR